MPESFSYVVFFFQTAGICRRWHREWQRPTSIQHKDEVFKLLYANMALLVACHLPLNSWALFHSLWLCKASKVSVRLILCFYISSIASSTYAIYSNPYFSRSSFCHFEFSSCTWRLLLDLLKIVKKFYSIPHPISPTSVAVFISVLIYHYTFLCGRNHVS